MPVKNVLLIIADDWSPIAACYGDSVVKTPYIDRLAQRSVVFNHAYCTSPSCAASRANILTGQYSHTHGQYGHCQGVHGFHTRSEIPTLPGILKQTESVSTIAGKTHIEPDSVYPFDHREALMKPDLIKFSNRALARAVEGCFQYIGDKPFFLLAASGYPHRIGGDFHPDFAEEEFASIDVCYPPESIPVPTFLPDTPEVRRDLAEYYRYITRFDAFVGDTLQALERNKRRDDTLVILLSDHGMPFPGAKASSFEAGHRCPLILSHPDFKEGGTSDALVNWCDILPTILDAMSVPDNLRPDNLPGRSLMPLLQNPSAPGWDAPIAYSHSFHEVTNYFPYRILRGPRYKYARHLAHPLDLPMPTDLFDSPTYQSIRETGGTPQRTHQRLLRQEEEALFDLLEDPWETRNLIHEAGLAHIVDDYREKLMSLRIDTRDPWLEIDYQEGRMQERPEKRNLAAEKAQATVSC